MKYLDLRSGSDVRGQAVDQPDNPAVVTEDVARRLGFAFAGWLSAKLGVPVRAVAVAVGRDSRVSGPKLAAALLQGAALAGARAIDCGLCTTPAMYMTTITPSVGCQGSVMVTASHHPWTRNGMKFFTREAGLSGQDIAALLKAAEQAQLPERAAEAPEPVDFLRLYGDTLAGMMKKRLPDGGEKPLSGMRIAVDAGNGAGGFYAGLLASLGADTSGSQFLEPDGRFPNHIPNPENDDAMAAISRAVTASKSDLGVIFDADCDRAAIVDKRGEPVNRNRLIALTAAVLLQETPGATIVTDSVTSAGLTRFIAAKGGVHYRFKRGYRNVIDEAQRLNAEGTDCPLAMETSGHAALKENYFLDDGMYLVTWLIVAAMRCRKQGGDLMDLIADLQEPVEAKEVRLAITAPDFRAAGQGALDALLASAARWDDCALDNGNREGVRLTFHLDGGKDNGWLLLRLSVHDPVLPINAEADQPGGVRAMLAKLREALSGVPGIDLTNLDAAL